MTGFFSFSNGPAQRLSPKEFGYLSVVGLIQSAEQSVQRICDSPLISLRLRTRIRETSNPVRIQFLAMGTASYWVYATHVIRVPSDAIDPMKLGMSDALNSLRYANGERWEDEMLKLQDILFQSYYSRLAEDFTAEPNRGEVTFSKVGEAAVHFHSQFYKELKQSGDPAYPDEAKIADKLVISEFAQDACAAGMMALREGGLKYLVR